MQMMMVEQKWPVFGRHELAVEWLRVWADLGRAPRTIDAYARALAEYLLSCENAGVDPIAASRAQVAAFVRELTSRPNHLGVNVVSLDSGVGLANATLQQRTEWHIEHARECGCRPIPQSVVAAIQQRTNG